MGLIRVLYNKNCSQKSQLDKSQADYNNLLKFLNESRKPPVKIRGIAIQHMSVDLHPVTKVKLDFTFPNYYGGKPVLIIPVDAVNISVTQHSESSFNDELLTYAKFSQDDYKTLSEYFHEVCTLAPGVIGNDKTDSFTLIHENSTSRVVLELPSYCNAFSEILPTKETDVLLINHDYMALCTNSITCETFTVEYDSKHSPATHQIIDNIAYNNHYNITRKDYKLPTGAFLWWSSSHLQIEEDDNRNVVVTIDYSKINQTRVAFTYGTEAEFSGYKQESVVLLGIFLTILVSVLGFLGNELYKTYRTDEKTFKKLLRFIIIIFLIYLIATFVLSNLFIEPFNSYFIRYNLTWSPLFIIIPALVINVRKCFYSKCEHCGKILLNKNLSEHKAKHKSKDVG